MSWFRKNTPEFITIDQPKRRERIGKDVWHKCPKCNAIVRQKDFQANYKVCPSCGRHERISALERIQILVDQNTFEETNANLISNDPLKFEDLKKYPDRVEAARAKTGHNDAVITGRAQMGDVPVSLAVMEFFFLGGSMGSVVGEKITRAMELAIEEKRVCITISSTGGARMQEGILSLMQLAKTSILCKRMQEENIPFISILTDPSTAGIMASFASLGDITIAEPGAIVGFAGRRVIENTIRQTLPPDFQTSEFVQKCGYIDIVANRHELRHVLIRLMRQMRHMEEWKEPVPSPDEHQTAYY